MELKIVNGLSWVRAHPELFFRTGWPSGPELAYHLMRDAVHLTGECKVVRHGGWWAVSSQQDWLIHDSVSVSEFFVRVVPAPEQGVNTMRGEVIVGAFAHDVGTFDGSSWTVVQGEIPRAIRERFGATTSCRRAVVFRLGVGDSREAGVE